MIHELTEMLMGCGLDAAAWARFILEHSPDDDAARRGMAEAIKRRCASGAGLSAKLSRIGNGHFKVKTSERAFYEVTVYAAEPGRASCNCKDFLRNALGLCKHVARVLATEPKRFAPAPRIDWDPMRPWRGNDAPWWRLTSTIEPPADAGTWAERRDLVWQLASNESDADALVDLARRVASFARRTIPVSPAADAVIRELALHAEARAAFAEASRRATLKKLKRPLFSYQQEGVAALVKAGRLLLGDDMGLGKTTQAIAAAASLYEARVIRRAVIVVPAALKGQWAREWSDVTDVPLTPLEGTADDRRSSLARLRSGIVVMSYEQAVRDAEDVRAWAPDLIVLDEAQRIKNWEAKTSRVMKSFTPRYRWVLTGTPFENRLSELASLVEWLDDFAMEPKWRLDCFHAVREDGETTVVGAKNLGVLRERIAGTVLRRTRDEVLAQLPARTDIARIVPLTDWQRSEHDLLNRDIAQLAAIHHGRALRREEFVLLMSLLNKQRMLCNAAILPDDEAAWNDLREASPAAALQSVGSPKLDELRAIVREVCVVQGRKIAIFSQWTRMLKWAHWAVRDLLESRGLEAGFFTGAENEKRRSENIDRFHDDPSFRVLFLSDAGGVGLNLQRAASALVNLELPWNPAVLEQRIARIYRFGQRDPVEIYLVSSGEGIEARIANVVSDKKALFKGLLEEDGDEIAFERAGALLAQLDRIVDPHAEKTFTRDDAMRADDVDANLDAKAIRDEKAQPEPPPSVRKPAPKRRATAVTATDMFEGVSVHRTDTGGLRIEASAEAADRLIALFEGMAALLANARR